MPHPDTSAPADPTAAALADHPDDGDRADAQIVELRLLTPGDYPAFRRVAEEAYPDLEEPTWSEASVRGLLGLFPEGQAVVTVNGEVAGAALALRVDARFAEAAHTYRQVTGDYTFSTHDDAGEWLYGIDIVIAPRFRGLRLGRRLYDYRKELAERLNLRGIAFGGRLPGYTAHADRLTARQYIDAVRHREIHDPVLNFQLSNDFNVRRILTGYLAGDASSKEYAALLAWDNIYYEEPVAVQPVQEAKSVVRLGLVQWQMLPYRALGELMEQVEYFVDAVSDYRCDFALFPEFFNAPLMSAHNHLSSSEAVRHLAEFTAPIRDKFAALAVSYNINVITGSMPEVAEDGALLNVGYLCRRDGTTERFEKIHVTPDEASAWGMRGGSKVQAFDTDAGRIGVLVCYDSEFPELSRLLAADGMQILFVPFLTDTQNGYSRVRNCSRARAIENECYVAIAGSVGNLPKVHNMDMQYAQSVVFTPCDFAFPADGVKAEATPNTEMVLVADVDLDLLKALHERGAVRNLKDRRTDVYEVVRVPDGSQ